MKHSELTPPLSSTQKQYSLMGLPFNPVSLNEAAEIVSKSIEQRTPCFLSTPNLNFTVMAQDDADFYNSVIQSNLVVADGMPLIWVAKLLGLPIYERVAGSDLFAFLSEQPREKKYVYFSSVVKRGLRKKLILS